ncbi:MAG: gamma-glutamyltransferase, partial [Saprospiraceae bacterium]|nr:gamma-glutamyltransferase [Saprospiraceae bacterium]
MKGGVISAGDPVTASAGIEILKAGGNAFDAAIAATFASFVSESTLTSAGGGGFCMAQTNRGEHLFYDFFTQTPHKKNSSENLDFYDANINFQDSTQAFKIGLATAAIPGNIAGLFHIHEKLGRMDMKDIIIPAVKAAAEGTLVTPFIRYNFHVINDILLAEESSRDIYKPGGKLLDIGDRYFMKEFADMLNVLALEGPQEFYYGHYAKSIVQDSQERGGHLTMDDFTNYRVIEREPLHFRYRGYDVYTNPPPSSGGVLIAFMLKLLEKVEFSKPDFGSAYHLNCLVDSMRLTAKARMDNYDNRHHDDNVAADFLHDKHFEDLQHIFQRHTARFKNTTHLSVADRSGNVASVSTSFGTGCGYTVPGTNSMLNNMLGEEDLNPAGYHNWNINERMTSMMAPTMVLKDGKPVLALGTGGANRIRTAI